MENIFSFNLGRQMILSCALQCEWFWVVLEKVREIFGIVIVTRARGNLILLQIVNVKEIEIVH